MEYCIFYNPSALHQLIHSWGDCLPDQAPNRDNLFEVGPRLVERGFGTPSSAIEFIKSSGLNINQISHDEQDDIIIVLCDDFKAYVVCKEDYISE